MNSTQYSPNSSEDQDDQPLDFSKKPTKISPVRRSSNVISLKNEQMNETSCSSPSPQPTHHHHRNQVSNTSNNAVNYLTTPSPSPPEQHSNQVLCQLLTGNLIPTSTGKVIAGRNNNGNNSSNATTPISLHTDLSAITAAMNRYNSNGNHTSPIMSRSPPSNVLTSNSQMTQQHSQLERHHNHHNNHNHNNKASSVSPSGSVSPIGLGPLNQVEMRGNAYSPNASAGVDRFGTSGGLLTTASSIGGVASANQVMSSAYHGSNDAAKRALKYSRPFKAYPRDPLSIPMGYYGMQMPLTPDAIATQSILATASDQAYLQFREQMLSQKRTTNPANDSPAGLTVLSGAQRRKQSTSSSTPQNNSTSSASPESPNLYAQHHVQQQLHQNHQQHHPHSNSHSQQHQHHPNSHSNSNVQQQQSSATPIASTPTKNNNSNDLVSMVAKTNGCASLAQSQSQTPLSSVAHSLLQQHQQQHQNSHNSLDDSSQLSLSGNSREGGNSGSECDEGDEGSMASFNGTGNSGGQSANMRKRGRPLPEDLKDEAYWERRRKNNEAAKRSRDARRAKEDEIAIRAAFLEQENLKLRCELAQLKTETTKLRCLLYNN